MSKFSPKSQPSEKKLFSTLQVQEVKLRQRALWAAALLFLLLGFILAFAIYQLTLVDFNSQTTAVSYIIVSIVISLLLIVIGAILILRWHANLGLNFVYYSGFLPVLAAAFLFSGRGITAAFTLGIISILIIFFVYPPEKRQVPTIVLLGTVSVAGLMEFIDPAYRTELPTNTQVGPVGAILFALIFFGILFNQAWKYLKVRAKLLSTISVLSLILIGVLTLNGIRNLYQQAEINDRQQLTSIYNYYNTYVATLEDTAASLAVSVAARPDVLALLQTRDRQGLLDLLTPVFNTLNKDYNIVHLYVEDPGGTVFVRIHNPESYGDDISYEPTTSAALLTKSPVAGVEIGAGRLGVRGVAPIFDGDQFAGLTEVGLDYDQAFIEGLKSNTNVDYTLWVAQEAAAPAGLSPSEGTVKAPIPELFFYSSTYGSTLPVPEEAYTRILESGIPETHYVSHGEQDLVVLIAPLFGYGERTIGIFEIISSRTQVLANIQDNLLNSLGVAALVSLIGFASLLLISQSVILHPINKLTTTSRQQLSGDLAARIPELANDEFGELGSTLNALTEKLQGLVAELEQRVEERTFKLEQANQQVQYRAEQFEAIAQISRTISSIQKQDELLNRITRMISQHFDFYHVGIFLLDDNNRYAVLHAANSAGGQRMLDRGHRLEVGQTGIVGHVTSTGKPRIALDTGTDAVYFDNLDLPDTRSEMALPLKVRDQIVGALDVQSTEPNAFTDEDINILSALADQVSAALENARLHEQTREALSKAESAYRESTGKAWTDIHRFTPIVGYHFDGTKAKPLSKPSNGGHAESQHEGFSVPVQLRGEPIGKLRINSISEGHQWTEDEIAIIQATAERVALAVENARLVSESQKRASKEQVISEVSSKISSAINLDSILQTALREMGRILPGAEISIQVEKD